MKRLNRWTWSFLLTVSTHSAVHRSNSWTHHWTFLCLGVLTGKFPAGQHGVLQHEGIFDVTAEKWKSPSRHPGGAGSAQFIELLWFKINVFFSLNLNISLFLMVTVFQLWSLWQRSFTVLHPNASWQRGSVQEEVSAACYSTLLNGNMILWLPTLMQKLCCRTYRQCRGIPQGAVVSSLLCCLFYGHMENVLFKDITENKGYNRSV